MSREDFKNNSIFPQKPEFKTTDTDIQIRFADVDILGHVNNVNLQHYFDLGKSDYFLKIMGVNPDWKRTGLITASTCTSYFAQTRPTERIFVRTTIASVGNKSFRVAQQIISHGEEEIKAESISVLVVFNFAEQMSIPFPEEWRMKASVE